MADHPGPERVAQVVKAQPAQPAPREGGGIASTQGGAVEACSCDAGEDWIVLSAEALTTAEARERLSDLGSHRDRAHLPRLGCGELAP